MCSKLPLVFFKGGWKSFFFFFFLLACIYVKTPWKDTGKPDTVANWREWGPGQMESRGGGRPLTTDLRFVGS